ncbi:MAG: haloacid dehalogenase type II [Candidatus Thiodiazotropha sp.]
MPITLAFDVYGTLIDTHGVVRALQGMIGDKARAFSQTWRDKQLEYAFRRGLMQHYENFAVCTRDALEYTCAFYNTPLSEAQKTTLLSAYRELPAFADVREGLTLLSGAGYRLFAFSNGTTDAVSALLASAGIDDYFLGVVSVDDVRSFKPNPAVYAHFLRESGAVGGDAWLISSNPFDVIGALSAGMRSAWVRRALEVPFDPWGVEPTLVVHNLTDLEQQFARYYKNL